MPFMYSLMELGTLPLAYTVADPGGDPRVPQIPPFSLAIMALLQLPASYLSVFVAIVL